jgi:succinoglycan biosynthesis protein ExoO
VGSVSVIIPARNASRWIVDAIHSVARQTIPAQEIIVVDNASTDETCAVVERLKLAVPSVTLVRNPRDLGPAASRNIGIDRAVGDWVGFLDADDWFAPERLQVLIDLGMREDAAIVADNQFFTHGAKKLRVRTLMPAADRRFQKIDLEAFLRRDGISAIGNLGLLKPVIRRRFLTETGVRYDEDQAIGVRILYSTCVVSSPGGRFC